MSGTPRPVSILNSPLAMMILNNDAHSDAGSALDSFKLSAIPETAAQDPISPAKDDLSGMHQIPKADVPGVIYGAYRDHV